MRQRWLPVTADHRSTLEPSLLVLSQTRVVEAEVGSTRMVTCLPAVEPLQQQEVQCDGGEIGDGGGNGGGGGESEGEDVHVPQDAPTELLTPNSRLP